MESYQTQQNERLKEQHSLVILRLSQGTHSSSELLKSKCHHSPLKGEIRGVELTQAELSGAFQGQRKDVEQSRG